MKVTTQEIATTSTLKHYTCELAGCGFTTEDSAMAKHHHGLTHAAKASKAVLLSQPDCHLFESEADANAHLEAHCERRNGRWIPVREVVWEGPGWYYTHLYEGWFRGESETRLKYRPLQHQIDSYRDKIRDQVEDIRLLRRVLK